MAPCHIWSDAFALSPSLWMLVKDGVESFILDLPEHDPILEDIQNQILSTSLAFDYRVWKLTPNGVFSIKSIYWFLIGHGKCYQITPKIFKNICPKKVNAILWLMWDNKILTLENLFAKRCNMLSTATRYLCHNEIEMVDHLFFRCSVATYTWHRFMHVVGFNKALTSRSDLWEGLAKGLGSQHRFSCTLSIRAIIWQICLERISCMFQCASLSSSSIN